MAKQEFTNINGIYICDQTARDAVNNITVPTKTSELTNDNGFATETFVTNKIAEASLGGSEVDLSGYVTKETGNASQITFSDGETFQAKLDAGTLKGDKGDKGDTGEQGPQGEAGPQGPAGNDGQTPNITIGTVTTLEAGSNATATITGSTPNLALNLGIPRGADGADGEGGSGTTTQTVTKTITVTNGTDYNLESNVNTQTANITWNVPTNSAESFTNILKENAAHALPKTLAKNFSPWVAYVNKDILQNNTAYFLACKVTLEADASVTFGITGRIIANKDVGDWHYFLVYFEGSTAFTLSTTYISAITGTATLVNDYALDVQTEYAEKTGTDNDFLNAMITKYGGLDLVPGQDYTSTGGAASSTLTSYKTDNSVLDTAIYGTDNTIDVVGGGKLSITNGSAKLSVTAQETISSGGSGNSKEWAGLKWVAFGDSITDGSINADTKYHKLIADRTGITVVDFGVGGTGYKRTEANETCFYQRMANIPSDADIITIMGSINDWSPLNPNGTGYDGFVQGKVTDTLENNTLCGYINKTIDVALEKSPNARLGLITPPPSTAVNRLDIIRDTIILVGKYRHIPVLNLWEVANIHPEIDVLAQVQYFDYGSEVMCHPSNEGHKIFMPQILQFIKGILG